jgi:rhamnose utilization protein RhaD (predicted bifunctional aldolase and dehydrogenase)
VSDALEQLISMSRSLGDPANDYVILGEGNTSARVGRCSPRGADADSFWVKASGTQLVHASRDSFVRVRFEPILAGLDEAAMDDDAVKQLLKSATVEGDRSPSIETFLHALCLKLEGVQFVGHTHATAAVGLLCSQMSRELFAGSMFPDQIVLLGPVYAYVPYADPGLPLALAVRQSIDGFIEEHRRVPKVLLMENHGVIALGSSPGEVLNITQMLVKTCRVLAVALTAGGPRFLSATNVDRIDRRPDELARRRDLGR